MTETFDTITDVVSYIETVLGGYAADYRINDMASERTEWQDGKLVFDFDSSDFYDIAKMYERKRPDRVKLSDELLQVSHDLQGVAVAIMNIGGDIEENHSGIIGTGWLCEMLGDKLIEASGKIERVMGEL